MTKIRLGVLLAVLILPPNPALTQGVPAAKDAYLYIISPANGETVKGAFWCRFGLRNMGVTHAGDGFANSGHHHLLIDADEPNDPGEPIPHDRKHIHYAAGETEALVELPPGKHTLQLVLGDAKHFNFDPPVVSRKITITVRNADTPEKRVNHPEASRQLTRPHPRTATAASRKPVTNAVAGTPRQSGARAPGT